MERKLRSAREPRITIGVSESFHDEIMGKKKIGESFNNVLLSAWNKAKTISLYEEQNTQLRRTNQAMQSDLLKISKDMDILKRIAVWGEIMI